MRKQHEEFSPAELVKIARIAWAACAIAFSAGGAWAYLTSRISELEDKVKPIQSIETDVKTIKGVLLNKGYVFEK